MVEVENPDPLEEIERLAALALAPLIEVAWADGRVTPAERKAVVDAAKAMGLGNREFCQTTLARWLHERPPTAALERWRQLLAPTLARNAGRASRQSQRHLLKAAEDVARMDQAGFGIDDGVTPEERRVLEELAKALASLPYRD